MAGTSTCQTIYNIGGGQRFVLQNVYSGEYLSAVSNNPLQQISSSLTDSRLWFTYDTSTMRIRSMYNSLCLDDLGHGYSSLSSTSDTLALTTCGTSSTQQFVYQPSTSYLLNPNNAYDKCIDGNSAYSALFLWSCPDGTLDHQWNIILVCPAGELSRPILLHSVSYISQVSTWWQGPPPARLSTTSAADSASCSRTSTRANISALSATTLCSRSSHPLPTPAYGSLTTPPPCESEACTTVSVSTTWATATRLQAAPAIHSLSRLAAPVPPSSSCTSPRPATCSTRTTPTTSASTATRPIQHSSCGPAPMEPSTTSGQPSSSARQVNCPRHCLVPQLMMNVEGSYSVSAQASAYSTGYGTTQSCTACPSGGPLAP